jgi:hypothetical protein
MSGFIAKFSEELDTNVAETRIKLAALKKTAELQTTQAHTVLNAYLLQLDDKIYKQSEGHAALEDDVEDWAFETFEKIDAQKDKRKIQKLQERARQAEKTASFAFSKALLAIDKAEREMLRSKIAHADAGILKTETKTFAVETSNL